jgi:hypothetical protein
MKPDVTLRMAVKLHRCLQPPPCSDLYQTIETLLGCAGRLETQLKLSRYARQRRWLVTGQAESALETTLAELGRISSYRQPTRPTPVMSLGDLHQDLLQLKNEFDSVHLDLAKGVIWAETEEITLEDVYLGSFQIRLELKRLKQYRQVRAFEIEALDQNPAAGNHQTVHPHVSDGQVCAGDATAPIADALSQGRICDAFLAVAAVLRNYNSNSAYVSLDDWTGVRCGDCESTVDESHHCDDCGGAFCDDCFSVCDICDRSCCRGCLEEDTQSSRCCCRNCRNDCRGCGRMVDAESFDQDSGLCPECFNNQDTQKENPHVQHDPATQGTSAPQAGIDLLTPELAEAASVPPLR